MSAGNGGTVTEGHPGKAIIEFEGEGQTQVKVELTPDEELEVEELGGGGEGGGGELGVEIGEGGGLVKGKHSKAFEVRILLVL